MISKNNPIKHFEREPPKENQVQKSADPEPVGGRRAPKSNKDISKGRGQKDVWSWNERFITRHYVLAIVLSFPKGIWSRVARCVYTRADDKYLCSLLFPNRRVYSKLHKENSPPNPSITHHGMNNIRQKFIISRFGFKEKQIKRIPKPAMELFVIFARSLISKKCDSRSFCGRTQ